MYHITVKILSLKKLKSSNLLNFGIESRNKIMPKF